MEPIKTTCDWSVGGNGPSHAKVEVTPSTVTVRYGVNGWGMPAKDVFDRNSSSRVREGAFGFGRRTETDANNYLANALSRCANQQPQGSAIRAALNGVQLRVRHGQ